MSGKFFPNYFYGAKLIGTFFFPLKSIPRDNIWSDVRNRSVFSPSKHMAEKVPQEPLPEWALED